MAFEGIRMKGRLLLIWLSLSVAIAPAALSEVGSISIGLIPT